MFLNPAEYILEPTDHDGYVIAQERPNIREINSMNLEKKNPVNFFIMDYLNRKEFSTAKKSQYLMNMNLNINPETDKQLNLENYLHKKKPVSLSEARIHRCSEKGIENHIIICGIVEGILNIILPLRPKLLDTSRTAIVILSNDNLGEDNLKGDTLIWKEINRFEEIYIIWGSALNPADLERAALNKAKAIVILSKTPEKNAEAKMMDADAIFMYKTIKSVCPDIRIVTELAHISTINFLIQNKSAAQTDVWVDLNETMEKHGYSISKPFSSGEIYF